MDICKHDYDFADFNDVSTYFKRVINLCKQMNYSEFKSEAFYQYQQQLDELLAQKQIKA